MIFQLKPVKGAYIFHEPKDPKLRAYHYSTKLWSLFESHLLRHNHRQGEGGKWTETLNRIRRGDHTNDDINILKGRSRSEEFLDENAEHVMYKNKDVTNHNNKMLETLKSPAVVLSAIKKPIRGYNYKIHPDTNVIDDSNFKNELVLKVKARISMIFNINTVDELVNGSSGTVVDFVKNKSGKVDAVIIEFDQPTSGVKQRERLNHYIKPKKHGNGTPIERYRHEYQVTSARGNSQALRAQVVQFPLCLSWASTSHKMQVIDINTYVNHFIL